MTHYISTARKQKQIAVYARMIEIKVEEQFRAGVSADRLGPLVGISAHTLLRYLHLMGVKRQECR